MYRVLLELGADISTEGEDDNGFTPLHFAAQRGDENLVKLVLEREMNIALVNIHGSMARDLATSAKQLVITNLLLQKEI